MEADHVIIIKFVHIRLRTAIEEVIKSPLIDLSRFLRSALKRGLDELRRSLSQRDTLGVDYDLDTRVTRQRHSVCSFLRQL
jgi:hypothetical protein